jgi:H+-transporting ATPase
MTSNAQPQAAQTPDAKEPSKPEAPSQATPSGDLKTLPLAEVEKRLESSPDGLTQAEASKRLTKDGPNELPEQKVNPLLKFLSYFWGPIPWMIEIAVILSGVVKHWPDFFIILVLLCTNAVVGFWEERAAGNAIAALKAKLATKSRVKRDGKWVTPPARELVPGDVIQLKQGDIVSADARLLDGDPMSVNPCRRRAIPAMQCFQAPLFAAVRATPWSTRRARTRISARPRSWSSRLRPSVTSKKRC